MRHWGSILSAQMCTNTDLLNSHTVASGDFDRNGWIDFVVHNIGNHKARVWMNAGFTDEPANYTKSGSQVCLKLRQELDLGLKCLLVGHTVKKHTLWRELPGARGALRAFWTWRNIIC